MQISPRFHLIKPAQTTYSTLTRLTEIVNATQCQVARLELEVDR